MNAVWFYLGFILLEQSMFEEETISLCETLSVAVNVRQNLAATGRNFGFVCHNDR